MAMFNSYVKLPEGNPTILVNEMGIEPTNYGDTKKNGSKLSPPKNRWCKGKNNIKKCGINPGWLSLMGKM